MQQCREGASVNLSAVGNETKSFQYDSKANSARAPDASAKDLLAPINIDHEKKRQRTK